MLLCSFLDLRFWITSQNSFQVVTGCGNINVFFLGFTGMTTQRETCTLAKLCALNLFVAIVLMRETLIGILSSDSLSWLVPWTAADPDAAVNNTYREITRQQHLHVHRFRHVTRWKKNPTKVSTGPSDDSGNRVQPCFFRWLWTTNPVTSLGSKQSGNCKKSRETSETPCSFTPAAELWVLAAVADTPLCCCALVWSSGEKTTQTAATQVTCLTHVATLISWMCEIPPPSLIRRLEEGPVRVTWQLLRIFWLHYFQPLEELWFEVEGQASVTLGWQSPGVDVNARTLSQKWIRTILTCALKASHYSNQGARRILQLSIWEIWSETSNSENLEIPTSAFKWNEPQIADFSDKTEVGNNSTNNPGEWSNLINPLSIYEA